MREQCNIKTVGCEATTIELLSEKINNIINRNKSYYKLIDVKFNTLSVGISIRHYAIVTLEQI